jgi:hypothetical protein
MEIFIQRNEKVIICANANLLYYSIRVFFAGISNGFILNRDEPRIHILKDFFYRVYRLKLYRLINTHVRDYKSWAIYNIGSCYGFRSNNFCFCSISNFARGLQISLDECLLFIKGWCWFAGLARFLIQSGHENPSSIGDLYADAIQFPEIGCGLLRSVGFNRKTLII